MINTTLYKALLFISLCFFISCESDDISTSDQPIINIVEDAKEEDLLGTWAIYYVENNDILAEVPINIEACGRDFFSYNNEIYEEFLFQESSTCTPTKNQLKWELNNGIISVSNDKEHDKLSILKLTDNEFVFSTEIDINNDNNKELFTFTAYKYTPPTELDIYTSSFSRREPIHTSIKFQWNMYKGYNIFEKYEIYRSNGENCDPDNAELIKTITDVAINTFVDESPIATDNSCYILKLYTDKGLLGESYPVYVDYSYMRPENIKITEHSVSSNNDVHLSWTKYTGLYFSHYEVSVKDKDERTSFKTVGIIDDLETTSYINTDHPIASELIYYVKVYDIFGNSSTTNYTDNQVKVSLNYPEILDYKSIKFLTIDTSESIMYLYARNSTTYELVKYDYLNNKTIATAYKTPSTSTDIEMQLIESDRYGKELLFVQSSDIWVYNADDLTYKYSITPKAPSKYNSDYMSTIFMSNIKDLKNNIWTITDSDYIYTFKREGENLVYIDNTQHFPDHQSSYNYEITAINQNNVLVSHNNEGRSIHYDISSEGFITNNGIKEIPLLADYNSDIIVNKNKSYILNKKRNSIYSTSTFSKVLDYTNPITTFSMNSSGKLIYGTNNDDTIYSYKVEETFLKEITIYNTETQSTENKSTKGYPLYVFEDDHNNIISISSSFPRLNLDQPSSYFELFVEVIK